LLHYPRLQPFLDQADDPPVADSMLHKLDPPRVLEFIERTYDTLPVISTSPKGSRLSALAIRSKADR
jgi:hypothetical protein